MLPKDFENHDGGESAPSQRPCFTAGVSLWVGDVSDGHAVLTSMIQLGTQQERFLKLTYPIRDNLWKYAFLILQAQEG